MRSVYRWDIQNWTHTKGDCIVIEGENKQPGERRAVSHGTMWTGCVKKKKKKVRQRPEHKYWLFLYH